MPAGSLATISSDSRFPMLAEAVSEGHIASLLQSAAGVREGLRLSAIEVLNHKPGRRCTLRYRIETASGGKRAFVAKWYRDLDEAEALYRRQAWIAEEALQTGLTMAAIAGYDPSRGVILQGHLDGAELRDTALSDDLTPFVAAGRWLARLHSTEPSDVFETKDLARELRKATAWGSEVVAAQEELAASVGSILEILFALLSKLEEDQVVIHRDFYPANLMWDGSTMWGIDFDQAALGDAGVDLGAFISQTEKLAFRAGLSAAAVGEKTAAFLDAYTAAQPCELRDRLPFFRSYTLLHVASAEVRRERPGWERLTAAFVQRALEVLRAG